MTLCRLALAICALPLSACVTTYPDISQSRSPCRAEPGGWCAFLREAAVDAFPYAIASTNAYVGDSDVFPDPGRVLQPLERLPIAPEDEAKGFGYELFAQYGAGGGDDPARRPIARIMAFRGTDLAGLSDIFYGSLRGDQVEMALRYFEAERARAGDGLPWIVTGHSLGGALATEVSVKHRGVRAYMFNTSPFRAADAEVNDMQRTVFNERGEILRRLERYDVPPAADVFTVNCAPQKNNLAKHKVRPLADCITWIAAYANADALAVVKANGIRKPAVECGPDDKAHPGRQAPSATLCVHGGVREAKGK